jgi:RimJ/RimL family protein N-acetyltransferase
MKKFDELQYRDDGSYSIRILTPDDVTPEYVKWISDPEITKYSYNRYRSFTLDGQKKYVEEMFNSNEHHLYGFFHNGLHIGNSLFGPIDWRHNVSDLRVVLGYKKYWGKGLISGLVPKALETSFGEYPFFKGSALALSNNLLSIFALRKLGFVKEGIKKYHWNFEGTQIHLYDYGLFLEYGKIIKDYKPNSNNGN